MPTDPSSCPTLAKIIRDKEAQDVVIIWGNGQWKLLEKVTFFVTEPERQAIETEVRALQERCEGECECKVIGVNTDIMESSCGHIYVRRSENDERFTFCPYCGKKIKTKEADHE